MINIRFIFLFLLVTNVIFVNAQDTISFSFVVDGKPLQLNNLQYTSKCGVRYEICQVQFFVSNVSVVYKNGKNARFADAIHYIDAEIPQTHNWVVSEKFTLKKADTICFLFGIDSVLNTNFRFKNPPENLMFWPQYLGGGYHYMKTNVRYIANDNKPAAFNCHIGRGQVYNAENEPCSYIENTIAIKLPIYNSKAKIQLDLNKLFGNENFNNYGGIMNNQAAMSKFCENIKNAFSNEK